MKFNSDLAGFGQSLAANTHSATASSNLMVGRRVMIRWPDDNKFYEAFISGYDPIQVYYIYLLIELCVSPSII